MDAPNLRSHNRISSIIAEYVCLINGNTRYKQLKKTFKAMNSNNEYRYNYGG